MSELLWSPTSDRIQNSEMLRFIHFCQQHHGYQGATTGKDCYHLLHQWSVQHRESFWLAIWQFYDVVGSPGKVVLQAADRMPGSTWFPDSSLNFAENLLAERQHDATTAVIEHAEDGRRTTYSYADIYQQVAQFSAFLRDQGVVKGDRVAAFLPNSHYALVGMLATTSLGAIWSSCSPDFGRNGVVDRFAQIAPTVLIACDGYHYAGKAIDTTDRVAEIVQALPALKQVVLVPYMQPGSTAENTILTTLTTPYTSWPKILEQYRDHHSIRYEPMRFSDPLYILYSSGTTGQPKCIVHSVGGTLLQHLKELSLHADVTAGSKLFYYTTCGWMMWNWLVSGMALGATLVLFDGSPFHPQQTVLFDIAEQEGINTFGASAKYYSACEKYGLNPAKTHDLSQLETLLSTGSPLSHESFEYLYKAVKSNLCVSSISGGTDIVSCFALGSPILPVYKGELQCAGLGMDLAFYDDVGCALPRGKGELVCRQSFPSMPIGFWNDPEGEKFHQAYFARFDNIWAHGDYGEFVPHEDSTLASQAGVIIHGRSDAVLNPGGVRIGTAEIYRQVEKIEQVFESLAIGQQWQDDVRIVLFVKLVEHQRLDEALENAIRQVIRQNTSPRHVPAKIIQVADIPKTLSGKMVELAVRDVVHGLAVKNTEALANPEALALFRDLPALRY